MKIGFVVHPARPEALETARDLATWLRQREKGTRCLEEADIGADETTDVEDFTEGLDLVISVGGDGTLLRAARLANGADAPVLGVKVGRVGFLTSCEAGDAPAALQEFLDGELVVEERMALTAEVEGAGWQDVQWALNEVVVEKREPPRMVTLRTFVGEDEITTFSADGVIVATATGSTAYSFAARGPIVSPRLSCLVITPVSPHMVFDRALVLAADERVTLEVKGTEPGLLSADGRPALELPVDSRVRIARAERPARLLRRKGGESFYSLLRRKFSLPGPPGATP